MNDRLRNTVVGFTTLLGLVALVGLLLAFGYVPRMLQGGYYVTLNLPDASSLNQGSRVQLSGIDIGEVDRIEFSQPLGTGVTVKLRIREEVKIPVSTVVRVDKPLIGGSPTIRFVVDNPEGLPPSAFLATDNNAVVTGSPGVLANIFDQVDRLANSFDALSGEWQAVGQKVNGLLEPQDLEAVEDGQVPGNLTTAVARIDRRIAEFKAVLEGVDSFVNNPQLREDLTTTAANVRQTSETLGTSLGNLETRYVTLADEVAAAVGQMNTLLAAANDPEGTVGKLIQDPSLFQNLDDTAQRIGQVADELKLLIEKWKAEGVPVNL
ncbi:MAG: MlaD family protein [Planctomycetota bacterium]